MRQAFESDYDDDLVFARHSDGTKALYLERGRDGQLYLCDYNNSDTVHSDEEIDDLVAHWRHVYECEEV